MCTLLVLLACAAREPAPPPAAETAPPEAMTQQAPLPTPFTAAQIRDAFRPGQRLVFTIASSGKPTVVSDWVVTGWTADDATIAFTTLADDGETVLEPTEERTTRWDELVQHAHFPEPGATRSQGVLVHPLGTLDIWLYTVPGPDEGVVRRYWFAESLPGPPIRFTITADGTQVFKMEQVERISPGGP